MFFCKNCLFHSTYTIYSIQVAYETLLTANGKPPEHSTYTIYSIQVAYETLLTANGKPPEPKLVRACSLSYKKAMITFTPIMFVLPVDLSK